MAEMKLSPILYQKYNQSWHNKPTRKWGHCFCLFIGLSPDWVGNTCHKQKNWGSVLRKDRARSRESVKTCIFHNYDILWIKQWGWFFNDVTHILTTILTTLIVLLLLLSQSCCFNRMKFLLGSSLNDVTNIFRALVYLLRLSISLDVTKPLTHSTGDFFNPYWQSHFLYWELKFQMTFCTRLDHFVDRKNV